MKVGLSESAPQCMSLVLPLLGTGVMSAPQGGEPGIFQSFAESLAPIPCYQFLHFAVFENGVTKLSPTLFACWDGQSQAWRLPLRPGAGHAPRRQRCLTWLQLTPSPGWKSAFTDLSIVPTVRADLAVACPLPYTLGV